MEELLSRISSRELTEWQLLYQIKADEAEEARHGEVIEHGADPGDDAYEWWDEEHEDE